MFQKKYIGFINLFPFNCLNKHLLLLNLLFLVGNLFARHGQLKAKWLIESLLDRNHSIEVMRSAWQPAVKPRRSSAELSDQTYDVIKGDLQ